MPKSTYLFKGKLVIRESDESILFISNKSKQNMIIVSEESAKHFCRLQSVPKKYSKNTAIVKKIVIVFDHYLLVF